MHMYYWGEPPRKKRDESPHWMVQMMGLAMVMGGIWWVMQRDLTPPHLYLREGLIHHIEFSASTSTLRVSTDDVIVDNSVVRVLIRVDGVYVKSYEIPCNIPHEWVIEYAAEDSAGNRSEWVRRVVRCSDTTPPTIQLAKGDETIEFDTDQTVVLTPDDVQVTDLSHCTVDIFVNDERVEHDHVIDANELKVYTIHYVATDAAGNVSDKVERIITCSDTTPPTIVFKSGLSNHIEYKTGLFVVSKDDVVVDEPATVTLRIEGEEYESYGLPSDVVRGWRVEYRCEDASGNQSDWIERLLECSDTIAPVVTLLPDLPSTLELEQTDRTLVIDATDVSVDDVDATKLLRINGASASFPFAIPYNTVQSWTVEYAAVDLAGNQSAWTVRTVQVVDTTPPPLTLKTGLVDHIEFSSQNAPVVVSANDVISAEAGADVLVRVDGTLVDTFSIPSNLTKTWLVEYAARDSYDNQSEWLARSVTCADTTKPLVQLLAANEILELGSSAQVTISTDDVDVFDESVCTVSIRVGEAEVTSPYTIQASHVFVKTVQYRAIDPFGNQSDPVSRTITCTDTIPPHLAWRDGFVDSLELGSGNTISLSLNDVEYTDASNDVQVSLFVNTLLVTALPYVISSDAVATFQVKYVARDKHGLETTLERTVTCVDTTTPTVTFTFAQNISIQCGQAFVLRASDVEIVDASPTTLTVFVNQEEKTLPYALPSNWIRTYDVEYRVSDGTQQTVVPRTIQYFDSVAPTVVLKVPLDTVVECGQSVTVSALDVEVQDATACTVEVFAAGQKVAWLDGTSVAYVTATLTSTIAEIQTIEYVVRDSAGNEGPLTTRTLTFIDTTPPEIQFETGLATVVDVDAVVTVGDADVVIQDVSLTGPTPTPVQLRVLQAGSPVTSVTSSIEQTIALTYEATDAEGNQSTLQRTIEFRYSLAQKKAQIVQSSTTWRLGLSLLYDYNNQTQYQVAFANPDLIKLDDRTPPPAWFRMRPQGEAEQAHDLYHIWYQVVTVSGPSSIVIQNPSGLQKQLTNLTDVEYVFATADGAWFDATRNTPAVVNTRTQAPADVTLSNPISVTVERLAVINNGGNLVLKCNDSNIVLGSRLLFADLGASQRVYDGTPDDAPNWYVLDVESYNGTSWVLSNPLYVKEYEIQNQTGVQMHRVANAEVTAAEYTQLAPANPNVAQTDTWVTASLSALMDGTKFVCLLETLIEKIYLRIGTRLVIENAPASLPSLLYSTVDAPPNGVILTVQNIEFPNKITLDNPLFSDKYESVSTLTLKVLA